MTMKLVNNLYRALDQHSRKVFFVSYFLNIYGVHKEL
jgi:hypothetical protein